MAVLGVTVASADDGSFYFLQHSQDILESYTKARNVVVGWVGSKRAQYELSLAIGERLFQAIKEKAPDKVLTDCFTCELQIAQHTGVAVSHPVVLLAASLTSAGISDSTGESSRARVRCKQNYDIITRERNLEQTME